jgi:magnesium-transporting ATPase (P-type)
MSMNMHEFVLGEEADDQSNTLREPQAGELVIDGKTLQHILDGPLEPQLALLGSQCESVVICRASPSQKAAIVKMMRRFEVGRAVGNSTGLKRWILQEHKRLSGKMLGIGDGANDVAMIQAADVGVGIMGKEGRQAVNNSDYAIGQFRFLVRLLLVHGTLSSYRLARLIKYSFYKNIAFAFVLFYFQFYNGFSGQALVDGISAAAYNVAFTSLPILLFAVLDRPVRNFTTLLRFPQAYNNNSSLSTRVFWKGGVLMAAVDAALAFFIPYYSIAESGQDSITDVYSTGKVVFVALLGAVSLEVALVSRYWTWLFGIFLFLSYAIVYPFEVVFAYIEEGISYYDPGQYGVFVRVAKSPTFWFCQIVVYILCFGHRFLERAIVWLFRPQDHMILMEMEKQGMVPMGNRTMTRLHGMGVAGVPAPPDADLEQAMAGEVSKKNLLSTPITPIGPSSLSANSHDYPMAPAYVRSRSNSGSVGSRGMTPRTRSGNPQPTSPLGRPIMGQAGSNVPELEMQNRLANGR